MITVQVFLKVLIKIIIGSLYLQAEHENHRFHPVHFLVGIKYRVPGISFRVYNVVVLSPLGNFPILPISPPKKGDIAPDTGGVSGLFHFISRS